MNSIALFGLLVSWLIAAPVASSPPSANGTVFELDGKAQYFAGTNAWWLGHLTSDADVDTATSEIAQSGLRVVRVWGFGNVNEATNEQVYYQLLDNVTNTISINYGVNGIGRLDSAIAHAEKYGLKVVLPFLNNWNDLGGINTYCAYAGCNATTFYTNAVAQSAYQSYISFVVNRYKNSPAIFAWELCNEPRCHGCSNDIIYNWASATSAYIKSLDPSHMVTLGDEGWFCEGGDGSYAYSCSEGVSFSRNLEISTLDYGTFHLYPDQWVYIYDWGNTWISEHAALAQKYNKPIVLEEYGSPISQVNRTSIDNQWQSTVLASNIAYDSFWQFGTTLPSGVNDSDVYSLYYGTMSYQQLAIDHAQAMADKDLR